MNANLIRKFTVILSTACMFVITTAVALGQKPAMNITPQVIDLYVQKRLRSVKRTTIHRELSDIRAVLSWSAKANDARIS